MKKMNFKLVNITSRSLGVKAKNPSGKLVIHNLIIVNDRVPASVTQTFGTEEANQETADILVYENKVAKPEAELEQGEEIGMASLPLSPGQPVGAPIEITLTLDAEGRLHVTGRDMTGGGTVEGDFTTANVISKEETAEAVSRSKQLTIS
jgi:molecular chaperone DnaK (HSP70)